jgi:AcrR family transcriptional regulator
LLENRQTFIRILRKPTRPEIRLEQIRQAAIDVFYERGYAAATMEDIASVVGIQAPSLYHYVSSKQELFRALHVDIIQTLIGFVGEMVENAGESPVARLRAFVVGHVLSHVERQKEVFIADAELRGLAEEGLSEVISLRDNYERIISSVLQDGVTQGLWKANVRLVTFAILAICSHVALWYRPESGLTPHEVGSYYADFILGGLRSELSSSLNVWGDQA